MEPIKENIQEPIMVPYVVHRDAVVHDRWVIKRITIALIISVFLMFASNGLWLYAWNLYDYETETTSIDSAGSGIANYTRGNGGVLYGEGYGPQGNP